MRVARLIDARTGRVYRRERVREYVEAIADSFAAVSIGQPMSVCSDVSSSIRTALLFLACREAGVTLSPSGHPVPNIDGAWTAIGTSGTTGPQKVVVQSVESLTSNARAFNEHMGFGSNHVWYNCLPMSYTAGLLNGLLSPVEAGATVVIDRPFDVRNVGSFWEPIIEHDVTAMWLTPGMVETLVKLDDDAEGVDYCRRYVWPVCVGTDRLKQEVHKRWEDLYWTELLPSYGLSELGIVSAARPGLASYGHSGTLLPGVEIVHEDPCLTIRTEHAGMGYWDGELIPFDDPFPTGDLGRMKAGELLVRGRRPWMAA